MLSNEMIRVARKEKRNLLEHESMGILKEYGISTPNFRLVKSEEEAIEAAERVSYPVVLKIVSKDIIHKSDVGCVKVGIKDKEELIVAYQQILRNAKTKVEGAVIEGLLLVEMVKGGVECIVGITRDEQFGPTIMFGLGGVFVELLEDVSLELLPITREEASGMIRNIKGYKLLDDYRGAKKKDIKAIEDVLLSVSKLVLQQPEIKEIDLNPVLVFEDGVKVLDARILL